MEEIPLKDVPSKYSLARTTVSSIGNLTYKISSTRSCAICLSTIFDPASLTTCGHKFCERCIDEYWQISDKPDFIKCPLCRSFAFDIDFSKKEKVESTNELRKTFKSNEFTDLSFSDCPQNGLRFCLAVALCIPSLYIVYQLMEAPVYTMLSMLRL